MKTCKICGSVFIASPSSKRHVCSDECSKALRVKVNQESRGRKWSDESKKRLAKKGKTPNLKLGSPAAQRSPKSGRFESNINAKRWVVQSPNGCVYMFYNLNLWARENTDLFGGTIDDDQDATRIAAGFRVLKRGLQGKIKKGQRSASSYKGWKLLEFDD